MGLNPLRFFQPASPGKPLGGRYKILDKLGAGGFGQTFLASDLHLPGHPTCVVKQLKPQTTDAASLQTARRLFDTEAQVLYQLGSHDQIPRLLAHFEDNQEFYLAQELVDGNPLSEELIVGERWSEAQVVAMLQDLLQVLAFVHQQNVIHRDIKPSNLMRRRADGRIVLIDFGAVKQASTQLANPNSGPTKTISIGTQGYMPNEQLGGNPRFSSDVYAVGIIAIQALTGKHPRSFQEDPRTGELQWCNSLTQVHPELAEFLDRMVRYDFRARYPTAVEALEALDQLPTELKTTPVPPASARDLESDLDLSAALISTVHSVPPTNTEPTVAVGGVLRSQPTLQSTPTVVSSALTQIESSKALVGVGGLVAFGVLFLAIRSFLPVSPVEQTATNGNPPTSNPPTENAAPTESLDNPEPSSPEPSSPEPSSPEPFAESLSQADRLRESGQYQQAVNQYEQAIALNDSNAEAHWGKCYSLNQLGQFGNAVAACDQAIALDPTDPDALWSKGFALDQQQRHGEALALYERAIELRPNFAEAWSNKGSALLFLSRPAEAVQAFDRAITLDPNLPEAWNNRGVALWSLQRFDEAIASLEKALQLQPDYEDAQKLLQQMRSRR